jgi:integrase
VGAGRVRARRGSGSVRVRHGRLLAQVSLGADPSGRRVRRGKTFDSRAQAEAWIATQQLEHGQLTNPVTEDRLADYLRWWLAVEAPKGKPGRRPLARTTLAQYRVVVEHPLIPELGHRKVGQLTVRELDAFASRRLAAGYAPATVNRMRETLRSALSTAVRQDRLICNVARYGGGVAARRRLQRSRARAAAQGRAKRTLLPDPPTARPHRSTDRGGVRAALARPEPDVGATAADGGVAARPVGRPGPSQDRHLTTHDPAAGRGRRRARGMGPPTTAAADGVDNVHGLVFTTRSGHLIDQRNVSRAFHRVRTAAGVDHGSLKTFRSTVATQLAEAGLHPSKTQAFLGHAHVTTTMTYYTAITDVDEAAGLLPELQ